MAKLGLEPFLCRPLSDAGSRDRAINYDPSSEALTLRRFSVLLTPALGRTQIRLQSGAGQSVLSECGSVGGRHARSPYVLRSACPPTSRDAATPATSTSPKYQTGPSNTC
ncbi:hypothetical protein SKAU_G00177650 [Synaphobranchus kaupii]|uniref:Uncharacterized protein n=1 Tax=Synaphobranchus kaupii TaxID=118154 RepID=A0A9Q1FLN6_SYNKA|nr:hypothetical protein SKAU_G00177650 [Synaphobranchus kaupii]